MWGSLKEALPHCGLCLARCQCYVELNFLCCCGWLLGGVCVWGASCGLLGPVLLPLSPGRQQQLGWGVACVCVVVCVCSRLIVQ